MKSNAVAEHRSDVRHETEVLSTRKPYQTPIVVKGPVLSTVTAADTLAPSGLF